MFLLGPLCAQEFRATLQGVVSDPSGSGIPAVELTLKNTDTNVERKTSTDPNGYYLFQFVPPGRYQVTANAEGFKTLVREGIELALGQNQRLDLALDLGAVNETIQVSAEVSQVQTTDTTLGAVIRSELKDPLPLKGRSSLFMFTLAPGVVNNRYGEDTRPNDTITNVSFSANGGPVAATDVAVDGAINTINVNRDVNISQWVPAVDSVAEFKVQMGIISAEFGRSAGSIMNIVIKSGTNEVHGTMYDYLRNSALDANNFFSRGQGQPLAAFSANTFGVATGAPIIKNKTFIFGSYEGAREGNGLGRTANVPTAKMRAGDFSEVPNAIFDPYSVQTVNGAPTRTPFPGNIIPATRMDAAGKNIVTFFPEANTTAPNPAQPWLRNFTFSAKWPRNYNTYVFKADHQINQNWNSFLRINFGTALLVFPHEFDGIASPGRNVVNRPHKGFSLGNTILLNPSTTLDLRVGASWGKEQQRPWSDGYDLKSLGFAQNFAGLVQSPAFPTFTFAGGFQGLAGSPYQEQPGYTWFLQPNMSLARGKHLMKIGGEFRALYGNFFSNSAPSGSFSFGNQWTDGPRADTPTTGTGFPIASLLMGLGSGSIDFNNGVSILNKYSALFIQDDYRITSKLTLNLGLRYEYETPRTERYDRLTRGFCYTCPNPIQAPGINSTGGLLYAGVGDNARGMYKPDKNNFSPRFGFAYSVTPRFVVRGGYGLYYIPIVGSVSSTGFSSNTQWVASQDGITPKDPLSNPYPDGLAPAIGNSLGLATLVGQNIQFIEPADRTPRFHTWNFNLQHALPGQGVIELGYVGSRGINIANDPNQGLVEQINQLDPQYFSLGTALTKSVPNPFYGIIKVGSLAGKNVAQQQLLRPYPEFLNVTRMRPAFGNTVYHSFQARFQKRLSNGLAALFAYTFSKNIGDIIQAQNAYNRRAERAVTAFDAPQRFTMTLAYDLPFGHGQKFLSNANRLTDLALGGWKLSFFNTFQSGLPLRFSTNRSNIFAIGTGTQRPDVIGDPNAGISGSISSRLDRYFNTAAFAQPADFTFGNLTSQTSTVRSPGMNNFNLALQKEFRITERFKAELRGASYNLLNHPVFSGPNTSFGGAAFGQITSQANLSRQTEVMLRVRF